MPLLRHCSRLSNIPAPDASDWRCPRGIHNGDDGFSRCQDNENRSALENTDVRVLTETKREDGLQEGVEKDAEETDNEADAERQGDREEQEDADWRHWNSRGRRGVTDHGRKEDSGDALTGRHAPGGTWLTRPHPLLTWAAAAGGVSEHHGTNTNGKGEVGPTREGGGTKRSASEPQKEKESGEKEIEEDEKRDEEVGDRENKVKKKNRPADCGDRRVVHPRPGN
ncbi:hypothetical protein NDU88_003042 [Pleurodeles waltl]|uniref:Uncharacterized protein n=1 Tax=Pleurodeles waltl TaxID=8319 RepID=A0AAV7KXT8_PLEWA|nr:hypothetical protein NDU88_003042 [Pleurodeles waltl]